MNTFHEGPTRDLRISAGFFKKLFTEMAIGGVIAIIIGYLFTSWATSVFGGGE